MDNGRSEIAERAAGSNPVQGLQVHAHKSTRTVMLEKQKARRRWKLVLC